MLPAEAVAGSIGCANPVALADLVADHADAGPVAADDPSWSACRADATTRDRYRTERTAAAGFADITITDSHQVADGFTSVPVHATTPGP